MLAGEKIFGLFSIEITDNNIAYTLSIGLHLSSEDYCSLNSSNPGGCNIEIQTLPFGYTDKFTIWMPHFR